MPDANEQELAIPADSFETWLGGRHRWLQTAAAQLIAKKQHHDPDEIIHLASLCMIEASGGESVDFQSVAPGTFANVTTRPMLKIISINDVQGVNAIRDGAALSFGTPNLSLIYGLNGSGKTGFSRIIKHAAGHRFKGDLRQNVFKQENKPSTAKIAYSLNSVEQEPIEWSLTTGPSPALKGLHLFDTHVAAMYVSKENEASYEPSRMRFVSSLIKVSDRVAEHFTSEKQKLISQMPHIPADLSATKIVKSLLPLKHDTSKETIDKVCNYTPELDAERVAAETAIGQKDIPTRLKVIARERAALAQINSTLGAIKAGISDSAMKTLADARVTAEATRAVATEGAKVLFENASLKGVGESTWRSLWEQARLYSEQQAYPGVEFPNVGEAARCVLCQQDLSLDPAAKDRVSGFESFVTGGLEANAKAAENTLSELVLKVPACPLEQDWIVLSSSLAIEEEGAKKLLSGLKSRIDSAATLKDTAKIPPFDWHPIEQASIATSKKLNDEEKTLKDLQLDDKRKELQARVLELRAAQWLALHKPAVEAEHARLQQYNLLERAAKLTNTSGLTTKNNALADDEISAGYQERFAQELEKLGGQQLPVKPVCKLLGKGKVAFGLALVNPAVEVSAESILSEGEHRIIALAAFLADITGSGQQAPFVFDDPISSLDQEYEERVVARLVDLSKVRQVIVFTHRLSLLALLDSAVSKLSEQVVTEGKPKIKLHVETLRRLGTQAGLTSPLSVRDGNPASSLNRMRDEFLPTLRKLHDAGDAENYDSKAEHFCTDFRILMERIVEDVLLNKVVSRFRRSIETKGKLGSLSKISAEDCEFLDDLMTRYSIFEHSQSAELPGKPPELDVLEKDVKGLANWAKEFKARVG